MKRYYAETIGTFILVFAGTGAIVINDLSGGVITHAGIAMTFGLTVMAVIYAIGDVSGAHINPAVTVAFALAGRFPARDVGPYVASQLIGALLGSAVILGLFPEHAGLGATVPSGSVLQSFLFEIVLTFILMFVILNVSAGAKEKGMMAGAAIGAVVGLEAMFAGPITGASMNPARSFGPALLSQQLHSLWIYIAAPTLGACLAVLGCRCVQNEGCCSRAPTAQNG